VEGERDSALGIVSAGVCELEKIVRDVERDLETAME